MYLYLRDLEYFLWCNVIYWCAPSANGKRNWFYVNTFPILFSPDWKLKINNTPLDSRFWRTFESYENKMEEEDFGKCLCLPLRLRVLCLQFQLSFSQCGATSIRLGTEVKLCPLGFALILTIIYNIHSNAFSNESWIYSISSIPSQMTCNSNLICINYRNVPLLQSINARVSKFERLYLKINKRILALSNMGQKCMKSTTLETLKYYGNELWMWFNSLF